jgi:hypothetical protein
MSGHIPAVRLQQLSSRGRIGHALSTPVRLLSRLQTISVDS